MATPDIRWKQRFSNYQKARGKLASAVRLSTERPLSELERQGLIQAFEFTHELAWNVLRDYFVDQGATTITGSRDATREAFNKGLLSEGQIWMDMIRDRNLTSHTYREDVASQIAHDIVSRYHEQFETLEAKLKELGDADSAR